MLNFDQITSSKQDSGALPDLITLRDPELSLTDILTGGEQIVSRLRTLSYSVGPSSSSTEFYTRIRLKSRDSIKDKINLKRAQNKPDYSFRNITDYIGFRLVTLYDNQLTLALEHIVSLIKAGHSFPQPLFLNSRWWNNLYDGAFHQRERGKHDVYKILFDHLVALIKADTGDINIDAYQTKEFIKTHLSAVKSSRYNKKNYSSAHLTFNAVAYFKGKQLVIPVEFQLRTAPEDIWAEINHKLYYKLENPYLWSPRFDEKKNEASEISKDIKKIINDLSRPIAKFRDASDQANSELLKFTDPNSDNHSQYPFSLCMSYFYFLDNEYLNDEITTLTTQYQNLCKDIELSRSKIVHDGAFKSAKSAIGVVTQIKRLVKSQRDGLKGGASLQRKLKKEMLLQREKICEFEILRLKAVILTYLNCDFHGKPIQLRGESKKQRKERMKIYVDMYSEFCNVKDS